MYPSSSYNALLRHERVISLDVEGDVMGGARAERPRSWRARRLVMQIDNAAGSAAAGFKAVVIAIDAEFAEAERLDEELFLLLDGAHRHHCAEEPARRHIGLISFVVHGRRRSS